MNEISSFPTNTQTMYSYIHIATFKLLQIVEKKKIQIYIGRYQEKKLKDYRA